MILILCLLYTSYYIGNSLRHIDGGKEKSMKEKLKKLFAYYRPYKILFYSDMLFAILGAAVTPVSYTHLVPRR